MNMENPTYQTEPKEEERFYPSRVEELIKQVFEDQLQGMTYDPQTAHELSERLTDDLRRRIKEQLRINRYKIGIKVIYGEKNGQDVKISSKCLWDTQFDNYATYSYENEKIYAVGIVYGCYFE
ncbi:hypothetical protein PPERSA_01896 [Pseudocohnilembus persalinus]|uniref:Tctex-1 n=1 Tax=Pseudocohnilembus persalinus TaxID=266149 RepID=A0A0V0R3F8_PSEPJ|nr:hypothetical protein PPERSA_01896 [Pseudocohnilembus persalinus]|eukprot:KRX09009.1 hypothetical protein PPERSA_01896 [Pseudocohnilembus persalinus]